MKRKLAVYIAMAAIAIGVVACAGRPAPRVPAPPGHGITAQSDTGRLVHLASYDTGAEGAEIVVFNPVNQNFYVVSDYLQAIDIVNISNPRNPTLVRRIDIAAMGQARGFDAGDATSVAINVQREIIAVAVQHPDFTQNGFIVIMDFDGNYLRHYRSGVQPDMIVFTPDGEYVLTANEGEPRDGFGPGTVDPEGSITLVRLADSYVRTVGFHAWDNRRSELVANGVLLKPGVPPSRDLEPEYIAVTEDSRLAFVSLQENNAIAVFDMATYEFVSIRGLGVVDHSLPGNEIALHTGSQITIQNENVFGVLMPDGIATININGVQYILTANEGDAREWGDFEDTHRIPIGNTPNVEAIINEFKEGLDGNRTYLLGSRSFSIFRADTMERVFDSGSDFERVTARMFPNNFNANHSSNAMNNRSNRKGPEPEDVQTIRVGDRVYAIIGLERIGGVFMYDITNPSEAFYVDYINIRCFDSPFSTRTSGDLGAEGMTTIPAELSPNGRPLVLVANEVSGTVTILEITPR